MQRGQSLIVWAIADGRHAAAAVDGYLMGESGLLGDRLTGALPGVHGVLCRASPFQSTSLMKIDWRFFVLRDIPPGRTNLSLSSACHIKCPRRCKTALPPTCLADEVQGAEVLAGVGAAAATAPDRPPGSTRGRLDCDHTPSYAQPFCHTHL
jgi:hypothetical protein